MQTVCRESLRSHAGSAHDRAVRWWQRFLSVSINLSTLSPPVAPKMLIWCLCIRERIGLRCWMMIRLSRQLSRVIHCITLSSWISSGTFPAWTKVKCLCPDIRWLWHHRNNLTVDDSGTIWRKRSTQSPLLQLLVPKPARKELFLLYHASLFGGHLGRNRTLARFYWSRMSDDVKEWLGQCVVCVKRKSPNGRHHSLGNVPTGHHWDRIAMDILDVCDPTPDGYRYILVIADYFGKWTEAFPIKNKCENRVADILVKRLF